MSDAPSTADASAAAMIQRGLTPPRTSMPPGFDTIGTRSSRSTSDG
jgi:hypothetical protein